MENQFPLDLEASTLMVWTWAVEFIPRFLSALAVGAVSIFAARWVSRLVGKAIADGPLDPTIGPVIAAVVRYAILIVGVVAVLGQLGVQTTSMLAALGAIGLAIGLALQGTLSNLAAGLMLLWLRPFRVGEYIDTGAVAGTVREIGLFATSLDTYDGIYRFVPNSALWNTPIINYSRNATRMTDMSIGIAYDSDIEKARSILLDLARRDERVAAHPPPEVFVDQLADSSVALKYRAWVSTSEFWPTQRYLMEETKRRFAVEGIEIPFPQRVVHIAGSGPGDGKSKADSMAA